VEVCSRYTYTWIFSHDLGDRAVPFQDVAKAGLKFGDESPEEEKAELESFAEQFKPLLTWLKKEAGELVRDGKGLASSGSYLVNLIGVQSSSPTDWS
jgi:hypothetical protein